MSTSKWYNNKFIYSSKVKSMDELFIQSWKRDSLFLVRQIKKFRSNRHLNWRRKWSAITKQTSRNTKIFYASSISATWQNFATKGKRVKKVTNRDEDIMFWVIPKYLELPHALHACNAIASNYTTVSKPIGGATLYCNWVGGSHYCNR